MSKLKRWHNKTWGDKVFIITVYVICILLTLICLYPLYFTVVASISNPRMVYHGDCYLIPKGINLNAYTQVFKNLIVVIVGTTVLAIGGIRYGIRSTKAMRVFHTYEDLCKMKPLTEEKTNA